MAETERENIREATLEETRRRRTRPVASPPLRPRPALGHRRTRAIALWRHLGKPGRARLGISALDDPDGQYVWLDSPDGIHS